jgi:hypothetical protein
MLLELTGGVRLKQRVQHPSVIERKDRGDPYWCDRARKYTPKATLQTFATILTGYTKPLYVRSQVIESKVSGGALSVDFRARILTETE